MQIQINFPVLTLCKRTVIVSLSMCAALKAYNPVLEIGNKLNTRNEPTELEFLV